MDDSIGILRQMLAGHEKHAALAEATGSHEVEYHRNHCRALRAAIAALDAPPVMYVTHDGKHGEYSTAQTSDARDALKALYAAYVRLLESGRDRILQLGGDCDPVDRMEAGDFDLIKARDAIAMLEAGK